MPVARETRRWGGLQFRIERNYLGWRHVVPLGKSSAKVTITAHLISQDIYVHQSDHSCEW